MDYDSCKIHGNLLRHAVTNDSSYVTLAEALKNPQEDYYCPGCGIALYPEAGAKVISRDYFRRGHFNAMPKRDNNNYHKELSQLELAINILSKNLSYSRDFNSVYSDVVYIREKKKGEVWKELHHYPIQIYAQRRGNDSLDAIVHVIELPLKSTNSIYKPTQEIARDRYNGKENKRFISYSGRQVELPKSIHQNIIIIKSDKSFKPNGRMVELKPTLFHFMTFLTGSLNYFNPETLCLEQCFLKRGESVGNPEHNPNKYFSFDITELPYFSLEGKEPVEKKRKMINFRAMNSVFIPHWKLAELIPINIDKNGNPQSVRRKSGQLQLLL